MHYCEISSMYYINIGGILSGEDIIFDNIFVSFTALKFVGV